MRRAAKPFRTGICTALAIALAVPPASDAQEEIRIYLPLSAGCAARS